MEQEKAPATEPATPAPGNVLPSVHPESRCEWLTADARVALGGVEPHGADTIVTGIPGFWTETAAPGGATIGTERDVGSYIDSVAEVFALLRRALQPDGCAWVHATDSLYSGRGCGPKRRQRALDAGGGAGCGAARKSWLAIPGRIAQRLCAEGWSIRAEITLIRRRIGRVHASGRPHRTTETLWLMAPRRHYRYTAIEMENEPAPDVWRLPAAPDRWRRHLLPVATARRCLQLADTPRGGLVLDPFAGTGTSLRAAAEHGANALGIDIDPRMAKVSAARLAAAHQLALNA